KPRSRRAASAPGSLTAGDRASVRVCADDFAPVAAAECGVGRDTDTGLEESHGPVREDEIGSAGVLAFESFRRRTEAAAKHRTLPLEGASRVGRGEGVGFPVDGYRRPRAAAVFVPEVTVGCLDRYYLTHHDRVARAIGYASDFHDLQGLVVEEAA